MYRKRATGGVRRIRTNIVRIGNSRGIRIPKAVMEQSGLRDAVDLEVVQDGQLVVRAADRPRLGWDDAFRRMAEEGDDELLDSDALGPSDWDRTEWEW